MRHLKILALLLVLASCAPRKNVADIDCASVYSLRTYSMMTLSDVFGFPPLPNESTPTEPNIVCFGSATAISKHYLITCYHCINVTKFSKVEVDCGNGYEFASVIRFDKEHDLCLLYVPSSLHPVKPQTKQPKLGDVVTSVGFPIVDHKSLSRGVVSALNTDAANGDGFLLQTDAAMNHGSSGGALFNEMGELIGINHGIQRVQADIFCGMAYATPAIFIKALLCKP